MSETLAVNPSESNPSEARTYLLDIARKVRDLPVRLAAVARTAPDLDPNALPSLETFERLSASLAGELTREAEGASEANLQRYRRSMEALAVEPLLRSAEGLVTVAESDRPASPNPRGFWDIIKCIISAVKCVIKALIEAVPRPLRRIFNVIYDLLCCIEGLICCLAAEQGAEPATA